MPPSVLEAYASGLPVVATDAGGVPAILTVGEHGLLAPLNDHGALAAHVLRLLAEPRHRRAARGGGTRGVPTACMWARVRDQWALEYRSVLTRAADLDDRRALHPVGRACPHARTPGAMDAARIVMAPPFSRPCAVLQRGLSRCARRGGAAASTCPTHSRRGPSASTPSAPRCARAAVDDAHASLPDHISRRPSTIAIGPADARHRRPANPSGISARPGPMLPDGRTRSARRIRPAWLSRSGLRCATRPVGPSTSGPVRPICPPRPHRSLTGTTTRSTAAAPPCCTGPRCRS